MSHGIAWFRRDLRLADNPAWAEATTRHGTVTALFVLDPVLWDRAHPRRRALLAAHLAALDRALADRGGRLRVESGEPVATVQAVARATRAEAVHFNADVSPYAARRDGLVAERLPSASHWGGYVHPVGSITTAAGDGYRVFTPFYRIWAARPLPPAPSCGEAAIAGQSGHALPEAGPSPIAGGEEAALARLSDFAGRADRYQEVRDRPDLDGTSRLSADLKFGTLSPRRALEVIGIHTPSRQAFARQLAWREFYAQIMALDPSVAATEMRPEYRTIGWRDDPAAWAAWTRGRTGFPIVDAGLRELRATGLLPNRVRMLAASFLVKDLLIDWRRGERFFRHHLLDGDVAQNVGNWQWVAGTGADAAPYFRIFNPVVQSRRFDPDGRYISRWVPELAGLRRDLIHAPWEAPPHELAAGGVELGRTYPFPIVDHAAARQEALTAYGRGLGRAGR